MSEPTPDDSAWYKAVTRPRVTVVDDGAFGMPDMFKQDLGRDRGPSFGKNQEETVEDDTFTLEVTTYVNGRTETFLKVEDARIQEGFLRIVQDGGSRVTSVNANDVTRIYSYSGDV